MQGVVTVGGDRRADSGSTGVATGGELGHSVLADEDRRSIHTDGHRGDGFAVCDGFECPAGPDEGAVLSTVGGQVDRDVAAGELELAAVQRVIGSGVQELLEPAVLFLEGLLAGHHRAEPLADHAQATVRHRVAGPRGVAAGVAGEGGALETQRDVGAVDQITAGDVGGHEGPAVELGGGGTTGGGTAPWPREHVGVVAAGGHEHSQQCERS
ncbi:MAG: hypothetical protein V9E94_14885 [Microthrixaceae bacterium]